MSHASPLALATVLALPAQAAPVQEMIATVLGHVVLGETEVDGLTVGELSGLRWSEEEDVLYAVSDRGHLVLFDLAAPPSGALAVEPIAAWPLVGPEDDRLAGFNPEVLDLAADGSELLIVSEEGPVAAAFDPEGRWLRDLPLPQALLNEVRRHPKGQGVEAAALHPAHGLLAAREQAGDETERGRHTVFAEDGRGFSFNATGLPEAGTTRIKDMAVLPDGAILILERQQSDDDEGLTTYLRHLQPADCPAPGEVVGSADAPCPTSMARIDVAGIADADFEGLAPLGDDRFLLVSDDKADGALRSVFALIQLARP